MFLDISTKSINGITVEGEAGGILRSCTFVFLLRINDALLRSPSQVSRVSVVRHRNDIRFRRHPRLRKCQTHNSGLFFYFWHFRTPDPH